MRPLSVRVFGRASQKIVGDFPIKDPNEILMFFLMRHGLPIASSCAGDGVCKRCAVNGDILSCQTRVGDWTDENEQVEIDYL